VKNFAQHITEAPKKDTVVIAFGRMNPPTIGHGVLVDKVLSEASKRNADHFIFASTSQDPKKNPLTHKQKVEYLKKFFPKAKFPLNKAGDPYSAVLYVCDLGYKNIIMVAGSDQVENFKNIAKYKGKTAERDPKKRKYSFDTFEVVQAGEARDDDAQGVQGMSASKMRAAAFDGDFKKFSTGIAGNDVAIKKKMYNDVRKGMNLKEEYIFEAKNEEDKVTILALTSSEKDLSDTIEKMEAICKRRKIEFYAVKTSKAQVEISNVASKKITIKNYDGEGKDAVVDPANTVAVVRGGVMNSEIGVAIMTILQNNGVFMINERGGMELCANKLETAIALKKHELPHPRTAFVADEENIESAVKEVGGKFPIICKTLTGAEGIGVSKIESMESLKSVLQTLWKYGAEVILQEFLPNFKNDVRSIVLNGKIFACAKRDKAPKDFRTNIARGSKGGSFQLSDEEIKLVERAARVSKCYYVGIDHVINDGKPYIIEMNASPGSGNIYYRYYEDGKGKNNVKGEELVEDFVDYILNKAHWKLFSNLAVREEVKIDGVEYTAKIDTGNSGYNMIHAEDIKDNGDHTVTFKLPNGKKVTKKIVSRITVKSGIGEKKRLVVLMDIEFHGKKYANIKFSLGDRSHMSTKVLIGLQFLSKTGMVVDPAEAIYPQPDVNSKRKGDEEEEEELSEMATKDAAKAVVEIIKTPVVSTKLFTLANKKKTLTPEEFKREVEKVKTEVMLQAYKAAGAGVALTHFSHDNKIAKLITKLFDKLMVSGGIDLGLFTNKLMTGAMSALSMLGMGDEMEGNPLMETIRHEGGKWVIYSKDGKKKLGTYPTETAAKKRLREIEFFKHQHEETVVEADVTKGKEFKTKSGKTKESPKDKASGLPKKYVAGLSKKDAELRKKRLEKRKTMSDDDPQTWEFVNPDEKDIKTKPSKYSSLYKKLEKKGKLKALKNQYEHDEVMERLAAIDASDETNGAKLRMSIAYEERCIRRKMTEAAHITRVYIDLLKEIRDEQGKNQPKTDINEDFDYLMLEVSPPSGPARRFSKKEKIKKEFQKRYGNRWKDVFYATAWKMHGEEVESSRWLDESKKINATMQWTAIGKRGPLMIGSDEIVKTYKKDTPGERERLGEEKSEEEKSALYKEWQKLVNMSGKEIQSFLDSDEGKEAGLSRKEAGKAGASGGKITSGRDSARAIIRMLDTPKEKWTPNDWKWAGKQVNFINRMKGAKGAMRDEKGRPTRKLLALKVWGYNPEKKS
jgi:RimK family alpha-L-glutamate ligase